MLRGPHLTSLGSQSGNRKTPFYSNKVPTPALHDDLLIMMRMPHSRCAKGNHSFSAVPTRHETQIHPPLAAAAAARVAQMKQRILHRACTRVQQSTVQYIVNISTKSPSGSKTYNASHSIQIQITVKYFYMFVLSRQAWRH